MSGTLRLLGSDRTTPLVSVSFGTVYVRVPSAPKLYFLNSYGDATCTNVEYGTNEISGSAGNTYAEICSGSSFDASALIITGTILGVSGTIASGTDLIYAVTAEDSWEHESAINTGTFQPSFTSGTENQITLTWNAIPGALKYNIYSNIAAAGYYKVSESLVNSYTDTSGTNDSATTPPASGSVAYVTGTWTSGAIIIEDMPSGTILPVFLRENAPAGSSVANNPKQHQVYCEYISA